MALLVLLAVAAWARVISAQLPPSRSIDVEQPSIAQDKLGKTNPSRRLRYEAAHQYEYMKRDAQRVSNEQPTRLTRELAVLNAVNKGDRLQTGTHRLRASMEKEVGEEIRHVHQHPKDVPIRVSQMSSDLVSHLHNVRFRPERYRSTGVDRLRDAKLV